MMLASGCWQDVEAGARRKPELHRISGLDRYLGPCMMATFILLATAVGQMMIGSVLRDPTPIGVQVMMM
jgi:hypothetical protein